jgi:hypothetical protein
MAEVAVYYRKDPSWMAKTPLNPPVEHSAYALVEVFHEEIANVPMVVNAPGWQDYFFKKLQNIETGDLPQKLGIRSMMHGDIITLIADRGARPANARAWQCEMVGWKEIRPDWLINGDLPHASPALVSLDAKEA